jgi:ribosomal protein L40E
VTIEKASALEEAAARRVVEELRAEIADPTIGRCRVCGARTAPWAALCDRCFMARGYRARR